MANPGIKELLQAGVHYGHQTRRWNPKMHRFIHGEAGGTYIIDLLETERRLTDAREFLGGLARQGGVVLFVGTKKQARDAVSGTATGCGMPYVNHRWLGGLLTNFQTINTRIKRLHNLEQLKAEGKLNLLPTKERMKAEAELAKLNANLGGVKDMQRVPDAVVVVDVNLEEIAIKEARRLRIPIVALVDTNCDPDLVDYVIPGNDDAIRSCTVVLDALGEVIAERHGEWRMEYDRMKAEEDERRRKEHEERQQREAEEKAVREAARKAGEPAPKTEPEATWPGEAPKEDPELPPRRGARRGGGGRPDSRGGGKPGEAKAEAPKASETKAEAPIAEAPKAEEAKAGAAKADAPKPEEPKPEVPKTEAPKAEGAKSESTDDKKEGE